MMFARCGVRILNLLGCLLLAAMFSSNAYTAPKWDTEKSAKAFEEALQQKSQIEASPQSTRDQYLKCAKTFRKVHLSDPHYRHTGDAIYEEALVYQKMGEKFGNSADFATALKRFELLVNDYGGNQNCPDSLLRIASIYSNIFKNEVAAENAYQKLRTRYKYSQASIQLTKAKNPSQTSVQDIPAKSEPDRNSAVKTAIINSIRYFADSDSSRIMIDLDAETVYHKFRLTRPDRIYLDISNANLSKTFFNRTIPVESEHLSKIRVSQNPSNVIRVVFDVSSSTDYTVTELKDPFRIVIDLRNRDILIQPAPILRDSDQHPVDLHPRKPAEQVDASANPAIKIQKSTPASLPPPGAKPQVTETPKRQAPKAVTKIGLVTANEAKNIESPAPADSAEASLSKTKKAVENRPEPRLQNEGNPPPAPTQIARTMTPSFPKKETKPEEAPSKSKEFAQKAVDKKPDVSPPTVATEVLPLPKTAPLTSHGDRTMTRMLGLKIGRIVLDPGHGGHDLGTIGPKGLAEKTLSLAIALELQMMLQDELGANVILTRTEDTYIPLEERTAIANQHRADLFLSIHANSSQSRSISGVETYYLDFAKTNAEREIAARENATSVRNVSDLEDLIKQIARADKSAESRELASIMQKRLFSGAQKLVSSTNNRGVRSAPFVVLIGANMPSVLAEVAFISNPRDERLLSKKVNQRTLARALFFGIVGYMETLGSDIAHNQSISK
jgi:N-acetylmuramoyl-L-alanine amidase